jgi:hypothetical protein
MQSHNFATLSDGAIDTAIRYAGILPSAQCEIFLALLGGEINRSAPQAIAYPHRNALYAMNVHAPGTRRAMTRHAWTGRAHSSGMPRRMRRGACTSTS